MSTTAWIAAYAAQAAFWLWLQWEALHDRPGRGERRDSKFLGVAQWLWWFDAWGIVAMSWSFLALTTIWLIIGLIAPEYRFDWPRGR